jgi:hypothetical protein
MAPALALKVSQRYAAKNSFSSMEGMAPQEQHCSWRWESIRFSFGEFFG